MTDATKRPRRPYRRRCAKCRKGMRAVYGDAVILGKKYRDAVLVWICDRCGMEVGRG